jgi:hypothetical protein
MACFRCGVRQTDPVRGASPWKRGVRADRQVLVCPACQAAYDWAGDLDRCAACDSVALFRRLGEVECRACGHVRSAGRRLESSESPGSPEASGPPDAAEISNVRVTFHVREAAEAPGLSEEVAQALDRVFKKRPLT